MAVTRRRDGAQIPGVEPDEEVAERARSFLASLDGASGATLVVGHGRMLRILIATEAMVGADGAAANPTRLRFWTRRNPARNVAVAQDSPERCPATTEPPCRTDRPDGTFRPRPPSISGALRHKSSLRQPGSE